MTQTVETSEWEKIVLARDPESGTPLLYVEITCDGPSLVLNDCAGRRRIELQAGDEGSRCTAYICVNNVDGKGVAELGDAEKRGGYAALNAPDPNPDADGWPKSRVQMQAEGEHGPEITLHAPDGQPIVRFSMPGPSR